MREMLAESLGDRSVAIAYWLPDREAFVDEAGHPVALPEPGSGRAWTAVEQDGRRVAAIVHDAALDTSAELVHAAAAASSLAIDNERLKADLRARVEDLRVSRLRIVEAADEARRRIERDLHDGAQQELLALALELRVLRSSHQRPGGRAAGRRARRAPGRRAERAARARARHPSRDPHPQRAGARHRGARRARAGPRARRERDRWPARPGGRGGRVLRRGRGADQRRALRARAGGRACSCAATATPSSCSSPTTASAEPTSTRAAGCAACRIVSRSWTASSRSTARRAPARRLEARIPLAARA